MPGPRQTGWFTRQTIETVIQPRWAYLGLFICIPAWLMLTPTGVSNLLIFLAVISFLPLCFPLFGILKQNIRAEIWGAYVSLPAFLVAVMESWSSPAQRPGALTQLLLVIGYWLLVILKARGLPRLQR